MQKLIKIGVIGALSVLISACGGSDDSSNNNSNAMVNAVCGEAAKEFEFDTTSFSGLSFCQAGTASPISPLFPAEGQSTSWVCKGLNSGTDSSCSATRKEEIVTTPETFTFKSENFIELGLLSNTIVTITTIDLTHEFYQTTTDELGLYTVDRDTLQQDILNILGELPEYLLVSATGGVDIDPNDDGIIIENEKTPLLGTVRSIIKTQKLLDEDNLSVNLISTAIADLLKDTDVTDQKLTVLTKSLGMTDINNDGKIDIGDVHEYSMLKNDSQAEEKLRKEYLTTLHENDVNASENALKKLKKEEFIIDVESEIIANTAYISFITTDNDLLIFYGKNIKKDDALSDTFSSPISLEVNQYIAYQACYENQGCGNLNLISFNGKNVELYIAKELESSMYDDTAYSNSLRNNINSKYSDYLKVNDQLYQEENKANEINDEIEKIKEKIKNIEIIKML